MSNIVFFVDLPNFYSRLLKSGIAEPKLLKEYFLNWLDFDVLAKNLAETHNGIWIFYSGGRIGPSSERIEGKHLQAYIRRINSFEGVSARDVNIPGEQREPIYYKCENCGTENTAQILSEKGIDTSLTVHLFDTMDYWDRAYLLSGDADFVPVVVSLRRRGKIVIGAGFRGASEALIQECYQYTYLDQVFLKQDFLTFLIFNEDGMAKKWMSDELIPINSNSIDEYVHVTIHWRRFDNPHKNSIEKVKETTYILNLSLAGNIDKSKRIEYAKELKTKFPDEISFYENPERNSLEITVILSLVNMEGITRNLKPLLQSIDKVDFYSNSKHDSGFNLSYKFNTEKNRYEAVVFEV